MSAVMADRSREVLTGDELDQRIAELVDVVRANQRRVDVLEMRIAAAKEELVELLESRGSNWSDDEGFARLKDAGVRKYYDSQALDKLIITDPLRYGWLKDYRKETTVRGGVQVK